MSNIITIVIPTAGRPKTLFHTLRSCVDQSGDAMRVVVSDNSADTKTRELVESFGDERIVWCKPDKRLCMAENWEFALSKVDKGYCCFIGDDDALLPGCIDRVNALISEHGKPTLLKQWPGNYFWPDYPSHHLRNRISLPPVDFRTIRRDGQSVLREVCAFKRWYGDLPVLYHGFVSTEHIRSIQQRSVKPFFNFCAPDIYSDVVLGLFTRDFLLVSDVLTLGGQSGQSNGANFLLGTEVGDLFFKELPPHLSTLHRSRSISLLIYGAIMSAIDAFPDQAGLLTVDKDKMIEQTVKEALALEDAARLEILKDLESICPKNTVLRIIESLVAMESEKNTLTKRGTLIRAARKMKASSERLHKALASLIQDFTRTVPASTGLLEWDSKHQSVRSRENASVEPFGIVDVYSAAIMLAADVQKLRPS